MEIEYSSALKNESDEKKIFNIKSFSKLDKTGLSFGKVERRILMKDAEQLSGSS